MKKALIAWGGWNGHEPKEGAERVSAILGEEGFDVTTVEGSEAFADPDLKVAGLHLFTFNQVAETEAWRLRLLSP